MLHLVTFGGLRIEAAGDSPPPRLRRSWLAMLAVVAAAGERGITRDRLIAIFWPESDEDHARQSARQALYGLRQELGRDVVHSSGPVLSLDPSAVTSDLAEFRAAIASGDRLRAVSIAGAAFLDGFTLPGAHAFQRWADEERERLEGMRTTALLALAEEATRAGRADDAVELWRALTEADELSGRYALGYLKALAARGDRAAALSFARKHESVIRRELEVDPDPDVRRLEVELRSMATAQSRLPPSHDVSAPSNGGVPADQSLPPRSPPTSGGVLMTPAAHGAGLTSPPHTLLPARRPGRAALMLAGAALLLLAATLSLLLKDRSLRASRPPVFAIGMMREIGIPDSVGVGPVLTDMLATNLARIEGLRVLANSRLLALLQPGAEPPVAYADAAVRAGATDLIEGHLLHPGEQAGGGLELQLRRVELRTGLVRDAMTVSAPDPVALVDSVTAAMARRFRLSSPVSSVAAATTRSLVAYRFYEEGLRAYHQEDHSSARRLMRAALTEDSSFAMAAYHEAALAMSAGDMTPDGRHAATARRTALRLAQRAPDRERLMITASVLVEDFDPRAAAVAESLVTRFPEDPASHLTFGRALHSLGDWAGTVRSLEKAIALDSAAGAQSARGCRVCVHMNHLTETYLWFDSLDAAIRTAERHLRFRPDGAAPLYALAVANARRGDSALAYRWLGRLVARNLTDRAWKLNLDLRLEEYDVFERGLPQLLWWSTPGDAAHARWYRLIALRNQGRLREADQFHRTGRIDGSRSLVVGGQPDAFNDAILALERGDGRAAARVFERMQPPDSTVWATGHLSRHYAWFRTLAGMAWAAAGDTSRVRALADSVEIRGRQSLYGRDRRLHHYLRGLVHVAAGRDVEAAREFREAIHSPSLGFTRVNYELGRTLLRLNRPADAVAATQPALRGEIDASNLYITRTELHELLAEAFDRTGQADSAAVHYRAVVRAWRRADPAFEARRDRATRRLAALIAR